MVFLFLSGCETTDKALSTTEQLLRSTTGRTIVDLAQGKSPKEILKERVDIYQRNPDAAIRDLRAVQRDFETIMAALTGKVRKTWGEKEIKVPERKRYVKYTQNYLSRAIVDFDKGTVLVETLDQTQPRNSLKNAIVTTLLTPNDPRAVDLFSDKAVPLTGEQDPYLLGLVSDQRGDSIRSPEAAEQFADYLIQRHTETRTIDWNGASKTALFVTIPMVANFTNRQADKYRALVVKFSEQYRISPSLVFAVIRTESNFNPFAVSSAPAYGLMQLVPSSGGREAYRKAKGQDTAPSRDYLFNPENNIELGVAYLNVLSYDQLEEIENAVSREYCVISAYNTGPRNTLKAFSSDALAAVNQINGLEPPAVYDRLRRNLPYHETRDYLAKVVTFRKQFIPLAAGNP
jgi:membrane-bound lytic murein transglycosylase C